MAVAKTIQELRRWQDLGTIREAVAACKPELANAPLGLGEVAVACKSRSASRCGQDWHEVRDQLLSIAGDWDLRADHLDQQSDECLASLAVFLRRPGKLGL